MLLQISRPSRKVNTFKHFDIERGFPIRRVHCRNNVHNVNEIITKRLKFNILIVWIKTRLILFSMILNSIICHMIDESISRTNHITKERAPFNRIFSNLSQFLFTQL